MLARNSDFILVDSSALTSSDSTSRVRLRIVLRSMRMVKNPTIASADMT